MTEPAYQPFHICNYANYLKWRDPTNPPIPKIKSLFQRAMEIEPKSPHVLGNYADFLAQFELDDVKAKELYQKALSEAPLHLGNLVSFAGFAFIDGNISEAKLLAQRALDHWSPEYNSLFGKAEILFTIWLSLRATGEIASEIENQLIGVLQEESTPDKWTFHRLLLAADTCLSVEDRGRANVLADSILKWKKPTEP